jgi:hypothetical protein
MNKILTFGFISMILTACSDATRTVPVLVLDERTISGDRPKLEIPPDYRNPTLPIPKNDTVISDYQKNNFTRTPKSVPLPQRRPY